MASSPPSLLLTVEKGPRAGETIECNPTGKSSRSVRIGRVIKGNTFTIKDPSISQKHLTINHLDGAGWAVTDLDTSNGTFVNDAAIDSLSPTTLKDGDFIKIGENTTISVKISERVSTSAVEVVKVSEVRVTRSRRYATRRGAAPPVETPGLDSTVGAEKKNAGGTRRGGRPKTAVDAIIEPEILVSAGNSAAEVREIEKLEVRDVDETGKEDVAVEVSDGEMKNDAAWKKDSAGGPSRGGDMVNGKGEDGESGRPVVDLEKMTLGEWFDSVEKYLPMVIEDIADEIIADLRERARRFNEFVSQRARQ